MKYMGSKRRIAKEILPIILKDRRSDQWYVEPFVGGCNIIDKVDGNRIGADNNQYLIALCKEMQKDGFELPFIGEKEYSEIKNNQSEYPYWVLGYVGFQLSFGAKWFGGYRRDKAGVRDYQNEAQQNLKAQQNLIKDVSFYCCSYDELEIPSGSIIYCDPPYEDTTKYKDAFDHKKFWSWCEDKVKEGHSVFVSEYKAPSGWVSVWEKEVRTCLEVTKYKNSVEKLFILR
jgi:DNA adenine methylase